MRFLSIFKTTERNVPPTEEEVGRMLALIDEMTKSGVLISTAGCLPSATGARVRRSAGRATVIDGPFTESKELIAGFALLEAGSKAEAIAVTKRFLEAAGDGECEIRQICEAPGTPADAAALQRQLADQYATK